jgi:hypothetical protein
MFNTHHAVTRVPQSGQREGARGVQSQHQPQRVGQLALRCVGVVRIVHAKRVGA